jgi:hypothetical protein
MRVLRNQTPGKHINRTLPATVVLGAVSFPQDTAEQALDTWVELEQAGFQAITVKDDKGHKLTRDQLILLSLPKSSP